MMADGRVVGAIAAAAMEEAEAGRVDAMVVSHATVSSSTTTGASRGRATLATRIEGRGTTSAARCLGVLIEADQPAAEAAVGARRVGPARSDLIGMAREVASRIVMARAGLTASMRDGRR